MVVLPNKKCLICCEDEDQLNLGRLYDFKVFKVHLLCVLTGHNLFPSGECTRGLFGFVMGDIYCAYNRYSVIKCCYCLRPGASLKCGICKKTSHLPCGQRNGVRVQMAGEFPSFCKFCFYVPFLRDTVNLRNFMCAICRHYPDQEDVVYRPVCCNPEIIIHMECLKLQALILGRAIKCPVCLNQNQFIPSVRDFGVYIPRKDMAQIADAALTSMPCSAKICRMAVDFEECDTIVPCIICKVRVAHRECTFSSIFLCVLCTYSLWPDISKLDLRSDKIVSMCDTFPWFFSLIGIEKYGSSLRYVIEKLFKLLGEVRYSGNAVNWHELLDATDTNLVCEVIKEYHADFMVARARKLMDSRSQENKQVVPEESAELMESMEQVGTLESEAEEESMEAMEEVESIESSEQNESVETTPQQDPEEPEVSMELMEPME